MNIVINRGTEPVKYLTLLLFAATPLYLLKFGVFGIPTNVFEILLYGVVAITAWQACRSRGFLRGFAELFSLPKDTLFRVGFVLFFGGAVLAFFYHPSLRGAGILRGWFFDPLLYFFIWRNGFGRTESGSRLFSMYALSGLVVGVASLGYALQGTLTYDRRLHAFFESPNHLAMYIAPMVLIAAWHVREQISRMLPVVRIKDLRMSFIAASWVVSFALGATILFLTVSAGAWIGVVGALLFSVIAAMVIKYRSIAVAIVILSGMLLPALTVHFWPYWQKNFRIPERSSISSRMMIWRSALEMIREHPLSGIGPGNFQAFYLERQKNHPPYLEWAVPQPHNIYLAFFLQTGILGFTGFMLLLTWFFKKSFSSVPVTRYSLLYTCIMLYLLIHGSVDTLYWKNDLAVFFWALLAVAGGVNAVRNPQIEKGDWTGVPRVG